MSNFTIAGVSAGTIIGAGSAMSPIGDLPSLLFLALQNVANPAACLEWAKQQTVITSGFYHPCYPNVDALRFDILSGGLVFIAIGLVIWWVTESIGGLLSA
jgi:hypothetical protein